MRILYALLLSVFCFRAEAANSIKWVTEGWQIEKVDGELAANLVMQRTLHIGKVAVPTMTLSFSEHPRKGFKNSSENEVAKELAKALGFSGWNSRKDNGFYVFEKHWKEQNRYLRLFVRTGSKKIYMSLASIRTVFMYPGMVESEILQRGWMSDEADKKTAFHKFWQEMILPKAYAQAASINIPSRNQITEVYIQPLADYGRELSRDLGVNAGREVRQGIENAATILGDDVSRVGSEVQRRLADTNAGINRVGGAFERLTDPATMGKVAFATGFAGVLGAAMGNFLVDGTVVAVKSLFYSITGKLDPKVEAELKAVSGEAVQALERSAQDLQNLEKNVDIHLAALRYAEGQHPDQLLMNLDSELSRAEIEVERIKHFARTANVETADMCARKMAEVKNKIMILNSIRPALEKGKYSACSNLKSTLTKIVHSQAAMVEAKNIIRNNMAVIMGTSLNRITSSMTPQASQRKLNNYCTGSANRMEDRVSDMEAFQDSKTAQENRARMQNILGRCQTIERMAASTDQSAIASESLKIADDVTAQAVNLYKALSVSDCKAGVVTENCNGTQGYLEALTGYYAYKRAEYNKYCPNTGAVETDPVLAQAAKDPSVRAGVPATTMAPAMVEKPKKGFIASFFSGIKNFVARIFSNQARNTSVHEANNPSLY